MTVSLVHHHHSRQSLGSVELRSWPVVSWRWPWGFLGKPRVRRRRRTDRTSPYLRLPLLPIHWRWTLEKYYQRGKKDTLHVQIWSSLTDLAKYVGVFIFWKTDRLHGHNKGGTEDLFWNDCQCPAWFLLEGQHPTFTFFVFIFLGTHVTHPVLSYLSTYPVLKFHYSNNNINSITQSRPQQSNDNSNSISKH